MAAAMVAEEPVKDSADLKTTTNPVSGDNALQQVHIDEEATQVRTKFRVYAILAALYMVLFITALDQTVIATAIPTIANALNSAAGYIWIGGAYLLGTAAAGPIWSKVSDIWGRKPVLLAAVFLFAIGSLIAALSIDMPMLIAGRAIQGVAGGGTFQLVAIVIADLFSPRNRALYLGLMGGIWAVAGGAGPLIGGTFTELVNWRWCFWINLPVCGVSMALLMLFLDLHNPRTRLRQGLAAIDCYGTVTILAVAIMILLGLNFGGAAFAWDSATVICLIVFGALMIGAFIFSEKKLAKYPIMPLGVFGSLSNNAIFIIAVGHSMVTIGVEFYLPLFFQSVRQASPLRSGILMLPITCMAAAVDVVTGILIYQTGRYRELIWAGAIVMTLGTGLYIDFGVDTSLARIVGFEIIGKTGVALLFQKPTIAIQNTVSQAETASAIASLSFLKNMAASLSVVVGGVVFQNSMTIRHDRLAAAGLSASLLDALSGDKAAANVEIVRTIADAGQRRAAKEAFAGSIRNIFILYTAVAGLTMLASIFVKHKKLRTEHEEHKTGVANLAE